MRHYFIAAMGLLIILLALILGQAILTDGSVAKAGEPQLAPWVLIELPGGDPNAPDATGILLLSEDQPLPVPVLPSDLQAIGRISPPEANCQPPPTGDHYHGALLGRGDPNPMECGWSRAVKVSLGSLAGDLAFAITAEEEARLDLRQDPPTFKGAERSVKSAKKALKDVMKEIERLVKDGRLNQAEGEAAVTALEGALQIDDSALDAIKDDDVVRAIGLLGDALAVKREVFRKLQSAGVLF